MSETTPEATVVDPTAEPRPRTSRKSPLDATGRAAEILAAEAADALKAREGKIALVNAQREEEEAAPIPFEGARTTFDYVEVADEIEVSRPTRNLRVNTDLENVTIGHGNNYTFLTGRTYKDVPAHVYNHLDEKGYVWH